MLKIYSIYCKLNVHIIGGKVDRIMATRTKYDINAEWDDPFEHQEDRRESNRCVENFNIKIAVQMANHADLLVGAGVVQNISQTGLSCRTKHRLTVGQDIQLSIHTEGYTNNQPLPRKFLGTAKVIRANSIEDGVQEVGVEFGSDLSENMSFTLFIENLRNASSIDATQ